MSIFYTINQEKFWTGVVIKSNRKQLMWFQKHQICSKFKPHDVFLQPIVHLYFYIFYFKGHEGKNLKNKQLGFHYTRHSASILLSAWCIMTNQKVAYIHDPWSTSNNTELETCLYANGSCHGLSDQSHAHQLFETDSTLLQ